MTWGEWLVPKLSFSAEAQLLSHINAVEKEGRADIEALLRVTKSLLQQNAYQAAIIRQAISHVGAIELSMELESAGLEVF